MEHNDRLTDHPGRVVIGPSGKPLALKDLPPPNTKRWVVRLKDHYRGYQVFGIRDYGPRQRSISLSAHGEPG